ncbi:MAG: polymerase subunit gamma/tau [Planctomycetota bacterium]|nr:polymerase subunit gamma/tau [Planctomycetota bacterium]
MARTRPIGDAPEGDEVASTRTPAEDGGYTVVARRYRPQRFEDVVGQDHVVQALRNAITLHRVTHAYLFCGTRGVGKTSIARIFAKALNCVKGPTTEPCNVCDICRAISVGQDVDVIEIDGASNNGVEAVRELRQNAGLRPSRARVKIYYIDEVHMLSTGAFNALLKTLEEPPEHVKFFFATTEANKIPITVLSRCQRYDFAGITPEQIVETLVEICAKEGVSAERAALATIARRAGGSMRDAQSLLEQMLSYGNDALTSESVHRALGIAPDERILELIEALADHDLARVLTLVDSSAQMGVQPPDLLAGVLDFLRDVMVTKIGPDVPLQAAAPSQSGRLRAVADRWPMDTILAAFQILDQAKRNLRGSSYGRMVVEFALARVARLEDFAELGDLIARLSGNGGGTVKKKLSPAEGDRPPSRPASGGPSVASPSAVRKPDDTDGLATEAAATPVVPAPPPPQPELLDLQTAVQVWRQELTRKVGLRLGATLSQLTPSALEPPGVLVVSVPARYNGAADEFEVARPKIEMALSELLARPITLRFNRLMPEANPQVASGPARSATSKLGEALAADPWVREIMQIFETSANPLRIDSDESPEV